MSSAKDIFDEKIKKIITCKYAKIIDDAPTSVEVIKFNGESGNKTNNYKRWLYGINSLAPSYKFLDIINWSNEKKAVVIGFNPSVSSYDGFDQTNKTLLLV